MPIFGAVKILLDLLDVTKFVIGLLNPEFLRYSDKRSLCNWFSYLLSVCSLRSLCVLYDI